MEQQAKASAMIGRVLGFLSGYLANLEADLGNRRAAEAASAENSRFAAMLVRDLPPDAFERVLSTEFTQLNFGYALPVAAGDYQSVRSSAQAAIHRIERFEPKDAQQKLWKNRFLLGTHGVLADALYNLREYEAADREIKAAIEFRKLVPKRTLQDERDAGDELILAAMIAARLERHAEAQKIVEPVLEFHRRLYGRGKDNDDLSQHVQLAHALYASALAAPGQRASQLTEAAAIVDRLPPAMRGLVSVSLWRNRIAEEQKRR